MIWYLRLELCLFTKVVTWECPVRNRCTIFSSLNVYGAMAEVVECWPLDLVPRVQIRIVSWLLVFVFGLSCSYRLIICTALIMNWSTIDWKQNRRTFSPPRKWLPYAKKNWTGGIPQLINNYTQMHSTYYNTYNCWISVILSSEEKHLWLQNYHYQFPNEQQLV